MSYPDRAVRFLVPNFLGVDVSFAPVETIRLKPAMKPSVKTSKKHAVRQRRIYGKARRQNVCSALLFLPRCDGKVGCNLGIRRGMGTAGDGIPGSPTA